MYYWDIIIIQTPSLLLKQSILDTGTMFFNYKKPHKFKVNIPISVALQYLTYCPGPQLHRHGVV